MSSSKDWDAKGSLWAIRSKDGGELSEWERSFLTSVEKSTYDLLTEKQEATYQKILQKYGFTGEVKGQKIIATHQELMDTF